MACVKLISPEEEADLSILYARCILVVGMIGGGFIVTSIFVEQKPRHFQETVLSRFALGMNSFQDQKYIETTRELKIYVHFSIMLPW